MSQDSRELFEAWLVKVQAARMIAKIGSRLSESACQMIIKATWLIREGDGYGPPQAQQDWETWQASREAVVVTGMSFDEYGTKQGDATDLAMKYAVGRIEAAGVKVAP